MCVCVCVCCLKDNLHYVDVQTWSNSELPQLTGSGYLGRWTHWSVTPYTIYHHPLSVYPSVCVCVCIDMGLVSGRLSPIGLSDVRNHHKHPHTHTNTHTITDDSKAVPPPSGPLSGAGHTRHDASRPQHCTGARDGHHSGTWGVPTSRPPSSWLLSC